MEKDEQELRNYLRKRLREYCDYHTCAECTLNDGNCWQPALNLSTEDLQKIYLEAYPTMKPKPEVTDQVFDYLKKEVKRQLAKEVEMGKAAISEDQRAKADYGKEQLTLVPRRIIHDICAIRMYGNQKYPDGGPDNWKRVAKERYRDAAYRHFLAYLDDPQGKDKESGMPHLWHLACNIAFLCEFEDGYVQPKDDDGPPCKHCLYFDEGEDGLHCKECICR